ncbi:nidogen-2 isoform X10 [Astyanax mexicanus]|uniref:nidogen-2 isoform X10 n=1 Tax=Astyanax mexicanus TaxID=7994 RepID=UPI0020CB23BF|nr:nidogen-2 isoform X10 [Astyanax mexicanus]
MRSRTAGLVLLQLSLTACCVSAIHRTDLFPYGPINGDLTLHEGDDETSPVLTLTKPMFFYETAFSNLYVATNGIISTQDLPMEKQYVDDGFPTEFPVIAPFLADIDTSNGKGAIYYRQTESPSVLNRVATEVQRGFPGTIFTPTHAVIATWENVAAYEETGRSSESPRRVNTFQAVVAYDETSTYALFLYPEDGLQFFGTRPKETFNVEIELTARVGFTRGEVPYFFFSRTEGPYYSVTTNEQSVKNLYQLSNVQVPGVWLFHIGSSYTFENVIPAANGDQLPTPLPQRQIIEFPTTPEYPEVDYSEPDDTFGDEQEYTMDPDFQNPSVPEFSEPDQDPPHLQPYGGDATLTSDPQTHDAAPAVAGPEEYPPPETRHLHPQEVVQPQHPQHPLPEHTLLEAFPHGPEGEVISVEEDINFDSGVIQYSPENRETCERYGQQCSQNGYCTDYSSGYCCHCHAGFYGNGRHCLPNGAPHRVNGKVSGTVKVGGTALRLDDILLHAYIVVGDGRAYTAISEVPEPLGWALMPVAPIGGLFGWLFALKLPNSHNGFNITGAEFTRHAEVIFYPGNQRLSIVQTGRGLDSENYLNVDTRLEGSVPFIAPGASLQMEPYLETYQYSPSLITSSSVREYTVVSAESGAETFSFQLRQNITYRDCRHAPRSAPQTLQLNVERIFVMYIKEERILRYAITNKIGQVGGGEQVNPCYSGNHDCDTTAQCLPGEGSSFSCQCATGYTGDGRSCYDVDECVEGLSVCGSQSECVNLPGSHTCRCLSGYEFEQDGRTCRDVDECLNQPCHHHASCYNVPGSFHCRCQPGFQGDGFHCHHQHERPKTQCEQHRDSLQRGDGSPPIGAYVPQCDEQGQYRQQQCHGSTGHCWCVDSRGQERQGTRTPPGTSPYNCDAPERPKTQCEQHRDSLQRGSDGLTLVGAYVPQCDEQGQYRPQQCHGSTGHCWCVDSRGQERQGTRTPPGSPRFNCDAPERPKTQCEQHRDSLQRGSDGLTLEGAFVPECDEQGQYRPQQCHGSTGHCWCVDSRGQERQGTRTPPGSPQFNCDAPERPKTQCEQHRDSLQRGPDGLTLEGAFVPECDEQGQYRPQQCHGSTGHCWCVDSRGQERQGTRTPPGSPQFNCDAPERPKTQCEQHRDSLQRGDGSPPVGAHIPQCDDQGQYRPQQCHGSTGHCWCVDSRGQERQGTRTPPGSPQFNCDAPERPKTQCEQHRDSLQRGSDGLTLVGAFVPECDEQGQYRPQQCHGSTGHCWCVDIRGQERQGTRTPPGSPQFNCDAPERPKTQCEQHRDSLQRGDGSPPVGAYVPQCDEQGQYRQQQCHGSTGHCWCVDSRGQERQGTRTPPGSPRFNCDAPVRPKTQCEQHRDSLQRGDGSPPVGAHVPQCDDQGQYRPQQCHGSTGHCWCVDSRGQERQGTRTPPGSPRFNCDAPVVPTQRPETVCERWRASLLEHYGGRPSPQQYLPQCDSAGEFNPVQCYGDSSYCWCVDRDGREVAGTRSNDPVKPACIPTVAPPTMRPLPRPDVTPPPSGVSLLYAQGQQIGVLPLNGTRMDKGRASVLLTLHSAIVVALDYDCRERKVYWTDLSGRTISRAALEPGAEPEILINTGLMSPEGLAVDVARRRLFWVDSTPDKIETANLDGSGRRILFNTDLVNPRAIVVDSRSGTLFWTDWNREAPKIESSTVDGHNRRVLVREGIGLPNALTYDSTARRVCWADAGTKRLECVAPDGSDRRVLQSNLNYPFSMVFFSNHYYYTDWRRDGVLSVSRDSPQSTEEYLPDQRSHLYGITVASTSCL